MSPSNHSVRRESSYITSTVVSANQTRRRRSNITSLIFLASDEYLWVSLLSRQKNATFAVESLRGQVRTDDNGRYIIALPNTASGYPNLTLTVRAASEGTATDDA